MARLHFTKMHGLGNDFIVVDGVRQHFDPDAATVRWLANRRRGVGCDQLLIVRRGPDGRAGYRIFNADGGEVEQCGNGARCIGRFVVDCGLAEGPGLCLDTIAGPVAMTLAGDGGVSVNMDVPRLRPAAIPFVADVQRVRYAIEAAGRELTIGALSMGNPHAVVEVDDVDTAPVETLGPALSRHRRFPNGANVGFMQRVDASAIRLRVYERGVGETHACGTGACAAAVFGRLAGELDRRVTVALTGGTLTVDWHGPDTPAWLCGPAAYVFEGSIEL